MTTRRGMPMKPSANSGAKVELNETNIDPEVDLAEPLVEHVTGHLRQPVVDRREEREHEPAHDRVVEMRHREEAAVGGHVARDVGEEDPGEPAEEEVEDPAEAEEHRHRVADLPAPERSHRAEEGEAGRDRDQLGGEHVERPQVGVDAADEEVVLPDRSTRGARPRACRRRRAGSPTAACARIPAAARAPRRSRAARGCTPPDGRRTRRGSRTGSPSRRAAATKKPVCTVRSNAAIVSAQIRTGAASSIRQAVEIAPQTKIGSRPQVIPGARIVITVASMFSPNSVIESPTRAKNMM